ncbi:MAG: hypothetical protein GY793_07300 [Proteobacteria bacterium]|nr:hypothetical protein [Pseudomonadota bacterium]
MSNYFTKQAIIYFLEKLLTGKPNSQNLKMLIKYSEYPHLEEFFLKLPSCKLLFQVLLHLEPNTLSELLEEINSLNQPRPTEIESSLLELLLYIIKQHTVSNSINKTNIPQDLVSMLISAIRDGGDFFAEKINDLIKRGETGPLSKIASQLGLE